jgi:hypothetical protein
MRQFENVGGWKSGRVEEWKSGRMEEWKSGRVRTMQLINHDFKKSSTH